LPFLGIVSGIAFANPLAEYSDPLFSKEQPCEQFMSHKPPGHHEMKLGEHLPPYLQGIDLTDVRKKSIKALIQKKQVAMQGNEKAGIEYHLYIQQWVFSKNYLDEKIAGMIRKPVAQHDKNEINMAKLDHSIFGVLTPEQKQRVQSNFIAFSGHMKKMQ
jgi:Spy/CpxP family protein refolding chaperone